MESYIKKKSVNITRRHMVTFITSSSKATFIKYSAHKPFLFYVLFIGGLAFLASGYLGSWIQQKWNLDLSSLTESQEEPSSVPGIFPSHGSVQRRLKVTFYSKETRILSRAIFSSITKAPKQLSSWQHVNPQTHYATVWVTVWDCSLI